MAGKKGMKMNLNHENSPRFVEYYQKNYPELTLEQCEEKVKLFKRSCNYQCIEYYEKNYPKLSHEEHLKLKEKLQEQRKKNKDTNIEYWKIRFPDKSLEELEELRSKAAKEKNKCNIEYWIKRYPEKSINEVKELHKQFFDVWLSHQEGWGKGEKNHNSKQMASQEKRNSMSPRNIAFYERKYPELSHEEHLKLQQDFFNKNALAIKNAIKQTNIEYYLNQGMSKEDAKIALYNRQSTFSLEKCIQKYGEIEGLKIFSERQQKWLKKLYKSFIENGDSRSPQSSFAKDLIKQCCKYLKITMPKKEKYIYNKQYKCAHAFDFTYQNKIIEFQGDYWHCNPKLYDETFYNKVKQKTAKEIWDYDQIKKECAEFYGYQILYIWEYDHNQNKEEVINRCIEFLNS